MNVSDDPGVISRILLSVSARSIVSELKDLQGKVLFSNDAELKDDDCEYFACIVMIYAEYYVSFPTLREPNKIY